MLGLLAWFLSPLSSLSWFEDWQAACGEERREGLRCEIYMMSVSVQYYNYMINGKGYISLHGVTYHW